jgi:hypothetical protein
VALFDHLLHHVDDFRVVERGALGTAGLALQNRGVDKPSFMAAFKALLMSSRSTSLSSLGFLVRVLCSCSMLLSHGPRKGSKGRDAPAIAK